MVSLSAVPRLIGHRGAAGHAPENTLVSMQKAFDLGARWVEVDVKLSADGACVLMHDATLERTTDGHGRVADATLAAIKPLDAGCWFDVGFAGERVPTLAELVTFLHERGMGLNLELKPTPGQERETGREVAREFLELWPAELPAPVISSFRPEALETFGEVAPGFERALLVPRLVGDWRKLAEIAGAASMHCGWRHLRRREVDEMREAGYPVRVYTVNDRETAEKFYRWGVETIITDYPERLA